MSNHFLIKKFTRGLQFRRTFKMNLAINNYLILEKNKIYIFKLITLKHALNLMKIINFYKKRILLYNLKRKRGNILQFKHKNQVKECTKNILFINKSYLKRSSKEWKRKWQK